ncbi:uncharacterized protein LOC123658190 [Melitaea cinxia]|uniref:uncharacterized protein LOC123658190 n=1 Tax=Melitaea cinxia TaxID=113334 RepID=UPI001E26F309|nr:uncharacterized protein LOC123658190 [Melitaea cinxia]
MSRKIILVLLFAIIGLSGVNSCDHNPSRGYSCAKKKPTWRKSKHHWRHKRPRDENPDEVFDIAQKYIDFGVLLQNKCLKNGNNLVYEVYDYEKYTLKYNISEYKNANVSVKISNRLINVNVKNEDENRKALKDVRLLPDILNFEEANWIIESDLLEIIIPYKIVFGQNIIKDCGNLNRNIIDVPLLKYDIDVRMGELNLNDTQSSGFSIEGNDVIVFEN